MTTLERLESYLQDTKNPAVQAKRLNPNPEAFINELEGKIEAAKANLYATCNGSGRFLIAVCNRCYGSGQEPRRHRAHAVIASALVLLFVIGCGDGVRYIRIQTNGSAPAGGSTYWEESVKRSSPGICAAVFGSKDKWEVDLLQPGRLMDTRIVSILESAEAIAEQHCPTTTP